MDKIQKWLKRWETKGGRAFYPNGYEEIWDVKSPASRTSLYLLKKKLMWHFHRIEIVEK